MTARFLWFVLLLLPPAPLCAQGISVIEIQDVQLVRSLAGDVRGAADAPMSGVLVEEFSSDWKKALRSTKTDDRGYFAFNPVKGRDVYFFQLTINGWNPLRVRVKVDPRQGKALKLKMEVST